MLGTSPFLIPLSRQVSGQGHVRQGEARDPHADRREGNFIIDDGQVAIKILEKDRIKDKKDVERITREIKILKKVRHPNVIQLYEVSAFK